MRCRSIYLRRSSAERNCMNALLDRNRSVIQFVGITLAITVAAAAAAGFILNRQNKDALIRSHIKVYPVLVGKVLDLYPSVRRHMHANDSGALGRESSSLLEEFRELTTVFRIKIWGRDGTVLWSDSAVIIGKNFRENEHFQAARAGAVAYSVAGPKKAEHEAERSVGTILEIYVPVYAEGRIAGVLELYENDEQLHAQIAAQARTVWGLIGGFGSILFVSLFVVFYRADASLLRAVREIGQTQQVTILALAYQAELRDADTGGHIERTSYYVRILAEGVRRSKRYPGYMGSSYVADIVRSAPLHDIGKVAVSDAILRKPGRLNDEEIVEIRKHCDYGVRVLDEAHAKLPFQTFLELARQLIQHHHERWDGTGYPKGLKGESIPLSGRIMAVADVYDALRSKRPYKQPLPHDQCVDIIRQDSGKQFDPEIVSIFLEVEGQFRRMSEWDGVQPSPSLTS